MMLRQSAPNFPSSTVPELYILAGQANTSLSFQITCLPQTQSEKEQSHSAQNAGTETLDTW